MWYFVWRDGGRTQWAFVSFVHPLTHEEKCCRVAHAMATMRYYKNRITTLLNDLLTASGLPNSYS